MDHQHHVKIVDGDQLTKALAPLSYKQSAVSTAGDGSTTGKVQPFSGRSVITEVHT